MKRTLFVVAVSLALVGCGDPKIDGKSEAAYHSSLTKVAEGLPEAQRKEFAEALSIVAMSQLSLSDMFSGKQSADSFKGKTIASLDGKTAAQVIDEASKIRADREIKEKQQAIKEVSDLLEKKAGAEKDRSELAKFTVSKSRFSMRPEQYLSGSQPLVELSVSNGTSHPISRAYFKGTIASPGRSVPWFSDDFSYSIKGGLEPGESADWSLAPNMFSDWGKIDAPADAVFTVEVVRLDGPDKKALFDSRKFGEADERRLKALQDKYSTM